MIFLLSCLSESPSHKVVHKFPVIAIQANGKTYPVEYAQYPHEVALGLRFRKLTPNEGILLNATGLASKGSISMKNMRSPISTAMIDSDDIIQDIWSFSVDSNEKKLPPYVKFIWEMPKGWFKRERIQKYTHINGIPKSP